MNPLLFVRVMRSLKAELKIVMVSLCLLVAMPIIAVLVAANAGIRVVSGALAAVDPVSHVVNISDANGHVTAQMRVGSIWPARGVVTLEFGEPDPPYGNPHTGIDIAKYQGEPVNAFMAGTVTKTVHGTTGYGNYVVIDHGNNVVSLYGHLSIVFAQQGQPIQGGEVLGLEGSSGNSTGPHVHFEIRVSGIPVNPRTFVVGEPLP
jgi:murein DD-endopeptidase MepM/ murein hydrolase activator NlpD